MANFFKKLFGTEDGGLDIAKLMSTQNLPNKDHKSRHGSGNTDQFQTATPALNAIAAQRTAEAKPAYAPIKDLGQVNAAAQAAANQMDQGLNFSPFNGGGPTPYPSAYDGEDKGK